MSTAERVRALVEPLVADLQLDLYDLEVNGGVVRVTVDQPGGGVGMDAIASLTRAVSRAIDEHDPIQGSFTLEVSSPGLERPLRTPAHFASAIGSKVSVKAHPGVDGTRRFAGTLESVGDTAVTVVLDAPVGERRTIGFDEIERARTVFEWGPAPKPGKGSKPGRGPKPGKGPERSRAAASTKATRRPPAAVAPTSTVPEEKVDAP
jgi:ribosome maturation factor RimP